MEGKWGLGALRPGCSCPEGLCVLTRLPGTVPTSLAAGGAQSSSHGRSGPSRAGARTAVYVCVCIYLQHTYVRTCVRVCTGACYERVPSGSVADGAPGSPLWTQRCLDSGLCPRTFHAHWDLLPAQPPPQPSHASSARDRVQPTCFSQKHPAVLFPIPSVYCTDCFIRQPVRPGPRCHAGAVSARASPRALPLLCFEACWCRSEWWPWSPPPKPKWDGACPRLCPAEPRVGPCAPSSLRPRSCRGNHVMLYFLPD